jgi:hypothetical protein
LKIMTNSTKEVSPGAAVIESYRLISVDSTAAPNGDTDGDWAVYRIARGENTVTGYRRGSRQSVGAEAERIVDGLNERLLVKRSPYRSGHPPKR